MTTTHDKHLTDAEQLDVYHDALDVFRAIRMCAAGHPNEQHLCTQAKRASESVVLNIAEGAGEFSAGEKARFYRIARRSATECTAVVDMLASVVDDPRLDAAKESLCAVIRQLVGLIKYQKNRAG